MKIQITAGDWNITVPYTLRGIEIAQSFLKFLDELEKAKEGENQK